MPRQVILFVRPTSRLQELVLLCLVAVILTATGCGRSPLAPDVPEPQRSPAAELATISGWVYASVEWADPALPDALVEIHAADGSQTATLSDANGFYEVSVRPGTISVTSSKEGHGTKTCEVRLVTNTVLNFFLDPS